MKTLHQSSKKSFNFKLKPISLIVLALFAQRANAEALTLAQADAQSKQQKQCEESATGSRAKAQCKTNAQLQTQFAADDAHDQAIAQRERAQKNQVAKQAILLAQADDVDAVLFGSAPENEGDAHGNAPFNISPEIIRTAETSTSPLPQAGEGKGEEEKLTENNTPNKINTPNTSRDSKALNKKEGKDLPIDIKTQEVKVRAKRFHEIGPLPGLGLTKEEIPGNVQSISAKEIKESHALSLSDLMNSKLQSVSVNDYQGNPFQMDVNYRGFTASPQLGTAQGISVFLDGIRVNEPFGDVVNWDMIPMNALSSLDIFPGSNPIFGLGTLGGALAMRTKSGFLDEGVDAEILAGSYGRKQLQISAGGNNGVIAGFASGNFFLEDGWRDNSPSKVNQVFGKAEWRNEQVQLGLSMLYAGNKLTGNGLLPEQMADQNRSQVYTSPDTSKNDLLQFQLSGIWDVSETFNVTGQIYNRKSKRKSKTTDVNEDFEGLATEKAAGKNVLVGFQDENNDGLPDYNNYAYNVAADAFGNALDKDGNICMDPNDPCVNNLATGTDFGTRAIFNTAAAALNQADVAPANGADGNPVVPGTILSWTFDPRRNNSGTFFPAPEPGVFNEPLPSDFYQFALIKWRDRAINQTESVVTTNYGGTHPGAGQPANQYLPDFGSFAVVSQYTDSAGFFHSVDTLFPTFPSDPNYALQPFGSTFMVVRIDPLTGVPINRDGAQPNGFGISGVGTGYIDGTPTALITETEIDQIGTGGALQLNWNLEQHKFMVGASVDMADAKYASAEYLGIFNNKRSGAAAPDFLGFEYYARDEAHAIALNDFKGDSITKSLYASETWSPIKDFNITAAARYNYTTVSNVLAVNRSSILGAASLFNFLDIFTLCQDSNADGVIDATDCPTGIPDANIISALDDPELRNNRRLRPDAKETYKYRSFNPALGATWQANESLNVYGNWNRGARTPTVIELGCAFDATPININTPENPIYQERSIAQRRSCNLPSTMAGDPYLKQVRSETFEVGARGNWTDNLEWNASVYRTDLQDDIYFVSVNATKSFFQNIGDTKRQGLEMGFKGKLGKARFGLNYSLTDATFQSPIRLDSPNNSAAGANALDVRDEIVNGLLTKVGDFQKINVKPGNRIPGIPLHNLNANFSYDITDKWTVGLNAVMHSSAFVRGNENNKHKAGSATPIHTMCNTLVNIGDTDGDGVDNFETQTGECDIPRANWREGKTPGFTVFNLQSSYKLAPEWTLGMQINNLFDKEYASAGRLGLNAFSPGVYGAIGAGGFNYNTSEWQGTSFLGLGAPRSAYVTLTYQFDPDKK